LSVIWIVRSIYTWFFIWGVLRCARWNYFQKNFYLCHCLGHLGWEVMKSNWFKSPLLYQLS
jgi:hypothetical protein